MAKRYSDEFKRDAVAMVDAGNTQKQVAAEFGISTSTLQRWVFDAWVAARGTTLPTDPKKRKARVQNLKQIRALERERDALLREKKRLSDRLFGRRDDSSRNKGGR